MKPCGWFIQALAATTEKAPPIPVITIGEGVDPPDRPLGEDAVLVEGDQGAERVRVEPLGEDRVGRAVALHHPVRDDRLRRPLGAHLLGRLAEGERLGLGEDVGHQQVVVVAERVVATGMKPMKSQGISRVPWWISW